jgi:eukaryotic-like serine/threonine-protein kinase
VASTVTGQVRSVVGERIADRYEVEELVGSGGMSSVYRAHDSLLDRDVALKILHAHYNEDEEYVERFRREARAVARLAHPNIVTVIDRGEEDGRQFIVFEYIAGENLKEHIDRSGPLPVRRALELALEIARALAFAHDQGLIHRDVKPQNVLLNGDGEAKVTDFGIARSLDVERGMTETGTVLGTSNYIAPEQASGRPVDAHTDVYSLGIVLYELLTGEVPFPGENFVAVAMKHINDPAPDLLERRPDVPPRLAAAVDRALQKDPNDRFPSMHDFAAELDATLAELGSPDGDRTAIVRRPAAQPARSRTVRRSRLPVLLSALALLAAAAVLAGVLALGGSKKGPPPASALHPIHLQAVTSYDPQGTDGSEHNDSVPRAADGNATTFWTTDHYMTQDFGGLKNGVGIVFVVPSTARTPKQLTVVTDTPGMSAKIQAGDSSIGPFHDVSGTKTLNATTTFPVSGSARYLVVWLTRLPPGNVAHVNEVRARG